MGRIGDVARIGRTVLFVSHNMGAVNQICQRAVWIEKGKVLAEGTANNVVAQYLSSVNGSSGQCRAFPVDPDKALQVRKVSLKNDRGELASRFNIGSRIHLEVDYEVHRMLTGSNVSVALTRNGMDIFCSFDTDANPRLLEQRTPGVYRYRVWLPTELLKAGFYSVHIDAGIINRNSIDRHSDVVSFRLEDYGENTAFKAYAEHRPGVLRMPVVWEQT
jgi:lipopolysaccharide transport system ATP-binding protein